jgi:hypothetical protein
VVILTDLEDFTKDQKRFGFSVTESLSLVAYSFFCEISCFVWRQRSLNF